MTVSSETKRAQYTGNGAATNFSVPFYFLEDADLAVYLYNTTTEVEELLTLDVDYTVNDAGNPAGGSIDTIATYDSNQVITIIRDLDLTQELDYEENTKFPAESHERGLDRLVMLVQQIEEQVERCVINPVSLGVVISYETLVDIVNDAEAAQAAAEAAQAAAEAAQAAAEAAQGETENWFFNEVTVVQSQQDQSNAALVGTIAYYIAQAAGDGVLIKLVGPYTYNVEDDLTIPVNARILPRQGALLDIDITKTVQFVDSPEFHIGMDIQYQIFMGQGKVKFGVGSRIPFGIWFGAVADDDGAGAGTDNKNAFEACINSMCEAVGTTIFTGIPGRYASDDIGQISINNNTNGDYDSYFGHTVKFDMWGFEIYHLGTGPLFFLQGQPSVNRKFIIDGGFYIGTASSETVFKCRDCSRIQFTPEKVTAHSTTPYLVLFQNWYSWSENMTITGYPLNLEYGDIQVEVQSADEAALYEGTAHAGGGNSFARIRMFNIFSAGKGTNIFRTRGSVYDAAFFMWGGNALTDGSLIDWSFQTGGNGTVIHNIQFEGGTALGDQYVVDLNAAMGNGPLIYDIAWGGSDGRVKNASITNIPTIWSIFASLTNIYDLSIEGDLSVPGAAKILERIYSYSTDADDISAKGSSGAISVPDSTATKIIDITYFSSNRSYLIAIANSANTLMVSAFIKRAQGTSSIGIQLQGTPIGSGVALSVSAGSLMLTHTLGSTQSVFVDIIRIR